MKAAELRAVAKMDAVHAIGADHKTDDNTEEKG